MDRGSLIIIKFIYLEEMIYILRCYKNVFYLNIRGKYNYLS